MRRMVMFFGICVISLLSNQVVYADRVHVHRSGHYLEWNGKPFIPVGDSVTQGWFLSGDNFKYKEYINALADRNMNIVMLWAFAGLQDSNDKGRLHDNYEEFVNWPWKKSKGKYNLNSINQHYYDQLKAFVDHANKKNMVVLITVFDGWIQGAFKKHHPFNENLGGPLSAAGNGQDFVELASPSVPGEKKALFPTLELSEASSAQKNQYYQEKFADKLTQTLMPFDNVIYEISNEKDHYKDKENRKSHEEHFLWFFRARLNEGKHTLLLTNEDQVNHPYFNAHTNEYADVVTEHGGWTKEQNVWGSFPDFIDNFYRTPFKPYIFSEPVKGWSGDRNRNGNGRLTQPGLDDIRRSVWETTLSGAGWVNQNDPSWGWNKEETVMSRKEGNRNKAYDYAGYCADFLNNKIDIEKFSPTEGLTSSVDATVLGNNEETEYVVYSPTSGDFTIYNLPKKDYVVFWLNPRNGTYRHGGTIGGGETKFSSPFDDVKGNGVEDSVLYLTCKPFLAIPSIIGSLLN